MTLWASGPRPSKKCWYVLWLRAFPAGGYSLNGFLDAVGSCFGLFRAFDPFDVLFFVSIRKTIKVFLGFWIIFQRALEVFRDSDDARLGIDLHNYFYCVT